MDAPITVATELEVGQMLSDRYVLVQRLAMGGMGEVWQARHAVLGTRVAVKLLRPHVLRRGGARERFFREAHILARLGTRRAVAVHDYGLTASGSPYLVMELVDGESLSERIRRVRALSPEVTTRILSQAARGLDRAHALGVAHLDFKPDNVLLGLDEDGRLDVKVADFGIAQIVGEPQDGALVGTLAYMSPEQIAHAPVGTGADVWAFGVVAYECLTGVHPFDGRSSASVASRIARASAPPASRVSPGVPEAFDAWFARACAVDPAARFRTATLAAQALADALAVMTEADDTRPHVRVASRVPHNTGWLVGGVAAAMLVAGVYVGASWGATRAALTASVTWPDLPDSAEARDVAPPTREGVEPPRDATPPRAPAPVLPAYRDYPDAPARTTSVGWKTDPYR